MSFSSRISGVGMFVPPRIVTNAELEPILDTSDEWIFTRTGIKERRWVDAGTDTSDLAREASLAAIEDAGIKKEDVDCIVFATLSPDHEFPGSACFLQAKLGLPGVPAIDIRQQCTGFLYGLSIADHFVRAGTYQNVLVVGAEVHSKGLDKTPRGRDISVLFGDGAGAAMVSRTSKGSAFRIFSTHLHADGVHAKELWIEAPGTAAGKERFTAQMLEERAHFPKMNGKAVFFHAVTRIPEAIREGLAANEIGVGDVDLFILHQANLRINERIAADVGIPASKVFNSIERFGNTTAATIPIGIAAAKKAGVLRPGMLVVSAAFGSGFTWGSAVYRW